MLSLGLYLDVGLQGVGWDEAVEEIWDEQTDRSRWRYAGLPQLDALQYVEGDNLLAVALSALMRVPVDRQARLKARAMERLGAAALNPYKSSILVGILEAYLPLHGPHLSDYDHLLMTEEFKMARQLAETTFEKGEKKGEEKGKRNYARKMLEARFGPLSEAAGERLESWPADRLDEVGLGLLQGKSLADLGLEDAPASSS